MKKLILLLTILVLTITLTGCVNLVNPEPKSTGGVFKSYDFGESWQPMNLVKESSQGKTAILGTKKNPNLDDLTVNLIRIDPHDHKNIYLGSREDGLWYSDNATMSWQNIFPSANVTNFVLDHQNKGVIYMSLGNKVYKTIDLGKNWQTIYLENRPKILITYLTIDPIDNLLIYLSTSNGELYKTQDGGESWQLVNQFYNYIQKIKVNPKDANKIYVGTYEQGIYKSSDKGKTWLNLKDNYLKDKQGNRIFRGAEKFDDLIFDLTQNDVIIFASQYGLLKSLDGGQTWQEIKLLTPPNSVTIGSLTINPQDNNQIYYSIGNAFYRTFDGGKTWLTSSSPSSPRLVNYLLVDPVTPNVVYMGMLKVKR